MDAWSQPPSNDSELATRASSLFSSDALRMERWQNVLDEEPDLCADGMRRSPTASMNDDNFEQYRSELEHVEIGSTIDWQVLNSLRWLSLTTPTSPRSRNGYHSYAAKHRAEEMIGSDYVSNGAMILAAAMIGVRILKGEKGDPNVDLGISVPKRLDQSLHLTGPASATALSGQLRCDLLQASRM